MAELSYSTKRNFNAIDSNLKSFDYILDNNGSHKLSYGYSFSYFNFENLESKRAFIHPKAMDLLKKKGNLVTKILFCDSGANKARDGEYVAAIFCEGEWYGEFDKILQHELEEAKKSYSSIQNTRFIFYGVFAVIILIISILSDDPKLNNWFWGVWLFGVVFSQLINGRADKKAQKSYQKVINLYNKDRIYKKFP